MEYTSPIDKRRAFISEFTGSAGTAVVTTEKAALWTDGRYYEQGAKQLTKDWVLMKEGLLETPSKTQWLSSQLPRKSTVSVDGSLYPISTFNSIKKGLAKHDIELESASENIIDTVWDGKPERPNNKVYVVPVSTTGTTWQEKIAKLRSKMNEHEIKFTVLSQLDDIAWLFNLRGSDISYNPVFFSYAVIGTDSCYLYLQNKDQPHLQEHFEGKVSLLPYPNALGGIPSIVKSEKTWINSELSYAIASKIENKLITTVSYCAHERACKNAAEKSSMLSANRKAAVALSKFFSRLQAGEWKNHNEFTACDMLQKLYAEGENYISQSFATISSSGPTSSIIHYKCTETMNEKIEDNQIYLSDSGAQYLDGTTDTTRTIWIGENIDPLVRECYTRVLQCHIGIAKQIFPLVEFLL